MKLRNQKGFFIVVPFLPWILAILSALLTFLIFELEDLENTIKNRNKAQPTPIACQDCDERG